MHVKFHAFCAEAEIAWPIRTSRPSTQSPANVEFYSFFWMALSKSILECSLVVPLAAPLLYFSYENQV